MDNGKELISLEIEALPPTVNQMYRNVSIHGITRRYKTPACHDFQDALASKLKFLWGDKPPYTENVSLYVEFSQKDRRRWDIDNRVKALQDCLSMAGVIKDDSQINFLQVERHHKADKTSTRLTLTAVEQAQHHKNEGEKTNE